MWPWLGYFKISTFALFSCSVTSHSLWPQGLQHARLLCASPSPRVHANSCPLSWWCHPLLLLPSVFPSIRVFSVSWLFTSGSQSIVASFSLSVFPINMQGWLDNDNIKNYFQDIDLSTVYLLLNEINEGEQKTHHQLREWHLKRIRYFILLQDISGLYPTEFQKEIIEISF